MAILKTATNKKGEKVGWDDQSKQWVPIPIIPGGPPPPSGPPPGVNRPGTQSAVDEVIGAKKPPLPGPPSTMQKVVSAILPPIMKGLEIADIPFKPLHAVKEGAIGLMSKVPALAASMEVPVESTMPDPYGKGGKEGSKLSGEKVTMPPLARTLGETAETLLIPGYASKLGADFGLRALAPAARAAAKMEQPLSAPLDDINASADALLKQIGGGVPEAAPAAAPVATAAEPPFGSLFGGPREQMQGVSKPPSNVIPFPPSPGAQSSLLPSPVMSPVRYGAGRGPVEPTPAPVKNIGGNVPQERAGTEAARIMGQRRKQYMAEIERIRLMLGAK